MEKPIIEVTGLAKKYRLGTVGATTLRDDIERLWRRWKKGPSLEQGEFWALEDITFSVRAGEIVGIIGKNGAGKSTLLKILSRITEPTSGQAILRGRLAALLEVGTGFHPELTGRENIFLNGAILGMKRAEVIRKFDEIVAFAEVEKFIDTPVKHYSSGMYVRLAFAVAAHLEPEILIVDEVLAVGDSAFQQKCLQKMKAVSREGRTVVFVSHNLSTVRQLCTHAILLQKGRVLTTGLALEVVHRYVAEQTSVSGRWIRTIPIPKDPTIYFEEAAIVNSAGNITTELTCAEKFHIQLNVVVTRRFDNAQFAIRVTNDEGIPVFTTNNTDQFSRFDPIEPGKYMLQIPIDAQILMPGAYTLIVAAHIPQSMVLDLIDNELKFTVHDTGNHINALKDQRLGVICPIIPWQQTAR